MNFNEKALLKKKYTIIEHYNDQATVQKQIAKNLNTIIPKKQYNNILEIGAGIGIFTKYYKDKIKYNNLILNDIYNFKNVNLVGNIEQIKFNTTFDLILSSSCLHWMKNLKNCFQKFSDVLSEDGEIIFSIFINGNVAEINDLVDGLKYYKIEELECIFKENFDIISIKEETIIKNFITPLELLKEFKNTGTNNFTKSVRYGDIKKFSEKKLTYEIAYIHLKKR